jgi:hypothetical protein
MDLVRRQGQFLIGLAEVVRACCFLLLRDLTLDLCGSMTMPVVSTPRSPDLAHLRTALWFHQQQKLTRFVTLDMSQAMSARELGLPV